MVLCCQSGIALHSISVQKIARTLHVLVLIALVCNLIFPPMVPGLVYFRFAAENPIPPSGLRGTFAYGFDDSLGNLLNIYLGRVWQKPYPLILTLLLLFSGICTVVILWQARRALQTILSGRPFASPHRRPSALRWTASPAAF